MLVLSRRPGEGLSVGDYYVVVNEINRGVVSFTIWSPRKRPKGVAARKEDSFKVSPEAYIKVVRVLGGQVRFGVNAPGHVPIERDDLAETPSAMSKKRRKA